MNLLAFLKSNKLLILLSVLYLLVTLPIMLNHVPYYDEAHGYMLAKYMNLGNWVSIVKTEGHPLLWYLFLMPFAKNNFLYPYSMMAINYLFCFGAILVMLKKAPFSYLLKSVIVFSSMFILFFPVCSRNYSIGIFGLFLLSAFYNEKLKHPVWYSLAVVFTAHTNILASFGASWFGIMLIFDMIKSKAEIKELIKPCLILLFGIILFIFPFLGGYGDEVSRHFGSHNLKFFKIFFTENHCYYAIIYSLISLYILITKNLRTKIFFIYVNLCMICLFQFIYSGRAHHFVFMFIYIIITFWLDNNAENNNKVLNLISLLMFTLLLLFPLDNILFYFFYYDNIQLKPFLEKVRQVNIPSKTKLYIDPNYYAIIPYLKGMEIYDLCTMKPIDYTTSIYCTKRNWEETPKDGYIITNKNFPLLRVEAKHEIPETNFASYLYLTKIKK